MVEMRRNGDPWWAGMSSLAYSKAVHALLNRIEELEAPIDMVLYCPNCGTQHVDKSEGPTQRDGDSPEVAMGMAILDGAWTNPPHRSHLCHACGCIWRPADVPTNGVPAIKTVGKHDSWPVDHNEELLAQPATRNFGHGWVTPRPDGVKARCGGPAVCSTCQAEKTVKEARRG